MPNRRKRPKDSIFPRKPLSRGSLPKNDSPHPELGFFSPRSFRRLSFWVAVALLAVAGIGAVVMTPPGARLSDAAVPPAGQITTAETIPTASPVGFVAVDQAAIVTGTRVVADNPFASAGSHPTAPVLRFSHLRYAWSECPEPPASASRVIWQSRAWLPRRPGSKKGFRSQRKHRGQRIAKTNAALRLDAKRVKASVPISLVGLDKRGRLHFRAGHGDPLGHHGD